VRPPARMTDSARGSGGRGEGGGGDASQPVYSPLNVFGVDPKHFQKWMRVWEEKRAFSEVQPSGDHLKKLNCVSPEFLLRCTTPPPSLSDLLSQGEVVRE
jgi:hypothetical protein